MQKHSIEEFYDLTHLPVQQIIEVANIHIEDLTQVCAFAKARGSVEAMSILQRLDDAQRNFLKGVFDKPALVSVLRDGAEFVYNADETEHCFEILKPKSERCRHLAQFYDPQLYKEDLHRWLRENHPDKTFKSFLEVMGWRDDTGWTIDNWVDIRVKSREDKFQHVANCPECGPGNSHEENNGPSIGGKRLVLIGGGDDMPDEIKELIGSLFGGEREKKILN